MTVKERFEENFKFEDILIKQTPNTVPPSCVYEAVTIQLSLHNNEIGHCVS
jgi:hypothetical protein